MFVVEDIQVAEDVGSDVLDPLNRHGKLVHFADWLYGDALRPFDPNEITIRVAPSIIARSESELLGISSPRFAFRAYLGVNGFVSIRRRKCIERHMQAAHGTSEFALDLIDSAADVRCNWIADCLLTPPERFRGFSILTCDLSKDYGETCSELTSLVPFVTHADFGGGLCAQAACFMALCLSPCQQILGISEITSEAMRHKSVDDPVEDPNSFRVRGLSAYRINSFFNSCKKYGIGSQLQHCSLNAKNASSRICTAVRTYLKNRVPVLQLVSLARMLGINVPTEDAFPPVITCSDRATDYEKRFRLPVGYNPPDTKFGRASHCVLVVGCSDKHFIINDPATFPFLQCSEEQLIAICAYDLQSEAEGPSYDLDDVTLEPVVDRKLAQPLAKASPPLLAAPSLFVAISVTDSDVLLPLLDPGREPVVNQDNHLARYGLFTAINSTLYDGSKSGLKLADPLCLASNLGEIYLATLNRSGTLSSSREGLPSDFSCAEAVKLKQLAPGKFWVHHVPVLQGSDVASSFNFNENAELLDSLWFWDACRDACAYKCFRAVFVRDGANWHLRDWDDGQKT